MSWHRAPRKLQQHVEAPIANAGPLSLRNRICWLAVCLLLVCGFTLHIEGYLQYSLDINGLRTLRSLVVGTTEPDARLWAGSSIPSTSWTIATFPSPNSNPRACGLTSRHKTHPGLICDPDDLLADASRLAIQDRLIQLKLDHHYVLGVAVVGGLDVSMFPWSGWHSDDSVVDAFAHGLIERWQLGDGTNGVMMVVVREPASASIYAQSKAVRQGLDPTLCSGIAEYGVLPYASDGHLSRGIVSGVEEIAVALRHPAEPVRSWQLSHELFMLGCVVMCLTSVICLCTCCSMDDGAEPDGLLTSIAATWMTVQSTSGD